MTIPFGLGGERDFEALFTELYPGLVAFAARLVDSDATAEDIVQGVFLELWRARSGLRLIGTPRSYLYAATRNRGLDYIRHQGVESRRAAELLADESIRDLGPDAHYQIEARETAASLAAAIAQLSERAQLVAAMRWTEGMSHAEIAAALGISVKGVEIQVTRILKSLRTHFRQDAEGRVG